MASGAFLVLIMNLVTEPLNFTVFIIEPTATENAKIFNGFSNFQWQKMQIFQFAKFARKYEESHCLFQFFSLNNRVCKNECLEFECCFRYSM